MKPVGFVPLHRQVVTRGGEQLHGFQLAKVLCRLLAEDLDPSAAAPVDEDEALVGEPLRDEGLELVHDMRQLGVVLVEHRNEEHVEGLVDGHREADARQRRRLQLPRRAHLADDGVLVALRTRHHHQPNAAGGETRPLGRLFLQDVVPDGAGGNDRAQPHHRCPALRAGNPAISRTSDTAKATVLIASLRMPAARASPVRSIRRQPAAVPRTRQG